MDEYGKLNEISLDGFQVVRSQYFCRQIAPCMTIWENCIAFSSSAYTALNKCEYINILVNNRDKKILIKPTLSKNPEAVKWIKNIEKPGSAHLECSGFTKGLFEDWKYNPTYHYRTYGKPVQCDKKLMLLFDFNCAEAWIGQKLVTSHER